VKNICKPGGWLEVEHVLLCWHVEHLFPNTSLMASFNPGGRQVHIACLYMLCFLADM
jgi:hypothetical protein